MSNDPVLSRLGFVRKAGRMSVGFAKTKEACANSMARLVVVASDVSEKSSKEIRFFAKGKVPVVSIPFTLEQLSAAIGIKAGIVSVNDDGFAGAIVKALNERNIAQGGTDIC